jgi:hypothetical protein
MKLFFDEARSTSKRGREGMAASPDPIEALRYE